MHYPSKSGNHLLTGLLGLAVGALLGVLYAPKSGRETRDDIKKYWQHLSQSAREKASMFRERAQQATEAARDKARRASQTARRELEE